KESPTIATLSPVGERAHLRTARLQWPAARTIPFKVSAHITCGMARCKNLPTQSRRMRRWSPMRHNSPYALVFVLLLLGSVNATRADENRAPIDLAKTRARGGVPLRVSERGKEISVSYLNKATKRRESAPADALENWVAELERIMDKKLEGDL